MAYQIIVKKRFTNKVQEKMAKMMEGMTLAEKKEFMQKIRDGKIKPV